MSDYIKLSGSIMNFKDSENWTILNSIELSIKNKIEKYGTKLSDWDLSINRGILTGYNDAFIIDEATKNALIASDPKSAELIRPILRGKDIKRYTYDFAKLWIIFVPCGFTNKNKKFEVGPEQWFKETYPSIYFYLIRTEETLSKNRNNKSKGLFRRDDKGDYWWELRSCKYLDDFNKPKLMYSEIVQEPHFYLDETEHYYPEATTFIMSGSNLKSLYVILNSTLTFSIFKIFYAGGGLGESGVRYKKAFLNNLRLPFLNQERISRLNDFYEKIKKENYIVTQKQQLAIDQYIANLYGLSNQEIDYLL